jgi:hypothetical protein
MFVAELPAVGIEVPGGGRYPKREVDAVAEVEGCRGIPEADEEAGAKDDLGRPEGRSAMVGRASYYEWYRRKEGA